VHHFEGENTKIFLERGHRPQPHWVIPLPLV